MNINLRACQLMETVEEHYLPHVKKIQSWRGCCRDINSVIYKMKRLLKCHGLRCVCLACTVHRFACLSSVEQVYVIFSYCCLCTLDLFMQLPKPIGKSFCRSVRPTSMHNRSTYSIFTADRAMNVHWIRHADNIPTMQISTGISGNTQSKSYMQSLTEFV